MFYLVAIWEAIDTILVSHKFWKLSETFINDKGISHWESCNNMSLANIIDNYYFLSLKCLFNAKVSLLYLSDISYFNIYAISDFFFFNLTYDDR